MANQQHIYYLLLGGNLGEVEQNFGRVKEMLKKFGKVSASSSIYTSEAWGYESENVFTNQVLKFETALKPLALMKKTQEIEQQLGRKKVLLKGYEDRLIDVDILLYDNHVFQHDTLTVPHLALHKRTFALKPLSEIAPDYIHPTHKKTIQELLKALG